MRRAVVGVRRGARALHVAVVGGGIVGVSTADELARRGCAVTLLEAAPAVASTASATHGNAGTLWRSMPGATPCEPSTLWHTLRSLSPSSLPPPPPGAPVAERRAFHARNTFVHAACAADPAFYRWALALLCSLGTPAYDWPAAPGSRPTQTTPKGIALYIPKPSPPTAKRAACASGPARRRARC